ncbi:DUF2301 domain-containing membrane protein [Phormidium sp. FACHB-1136]|uniref:DUF2301 domain-containing membrane protein n=1 Tax=Phormidium sp. FACHB-1136 TaxID=2692848 RepID=UPI001683FB56|nr:DUF2301 domain-containing membrane protein [Phormidium sp. FACHB-1136]MBD2426387.1 DUF2301 domain-containing membrane protein [Phormidium sp. FACHB-1136]
MSNAVNAAVSDAPVVYQGQFGDYTITDQDRLGVQLYRGGLVAAALALALGVMLGLGFPEKPSLVQAISLCYTLFWLGLGVSLATVHIYLVPLHRLLQGFWLVGGLASLALAHGIDGPLAETVVTQPQTLWGIGFTFAALTGLYIKEAFCFNRLETKLLMPLVPLLLLGHLFGLLPVVVEQGLLILWAILFGIFALRKLAQPLVPDIGDKSVFEYLKTREK